MSFWSDIVDTVGDFVEDVANEAGELIADTAETAGNAAADGLNALGDFFSGERGGKPTNPDSINIFRWLAKVVGGATNLAGAIIKGAFNIVGGVIGGLIKVIFSFDLKVILEGLVDIGSGIAGALIMILLKAGALIQRIFFLEERDRPLTRKEKNMLKKVFRNSISYYNLRIIDDWSGLYGVSGAAWTVGNTIYLNGTNTDDEPFTLVHETVHVWQYQNIGTRYVMDAWGAQMAYGRTGEAGDAYDWTEELRRGTFDWLDFNKEAQAQLVNEIWSDGVLIKDGVPGIPYLHDITDAHGTPILDGHGNPLKNMEGGKFYELPECIASNDGTCDVQFIALDETLTHAARDGVDHTGLAKKSVKSLQTPVNIRISRALNNI